MKGKEIVILGGGESGVGAALLAQKMGLKVFLSDYSLIKQKYLKKLEQFNIPFEHGKHTEERILNANEIIKSPGISLEVEIVKKAIVKNIPVISDIEFGFRFCKGKIIAITGSNGKTTTTSLIGHIFKTAGMKAMIGGNIGVSFAENVMTNPNATHIIEVSSYQLEDTFRFRPEIALITNITEDHLDRHKTMENYIASKFKITLNQTKNDFLIVNLEDLNSQNYLKKNSQLKAKQLNFSTKQKADAFTEGKDFALKFLNTNFNMTISDLALVGNHNIQNSLAAAMVASLSGIKNSIIRESLSSFQSVEHRLESVGSVKGIEFINDSKATNTNAVYYALESMEKPVIWIAGGVDKGNDYTELEELVKQKVDAIICLGKDNKKIVKFFKDEVPVFETSSMKESVRMAYKLGQKGDVVLLSPACASFDLFNDYTQRGKEFKNAVKNL